jgi:hypothetical protein
LAANSSKLEREAVMRRQSFARRLELFRGKALFRLDIQLCSKSHDPNAHGRAQPGIGNVTNG